MDEASLTEALLGRGLSRKTVVCYLRAIRRPRAELGLETVSATDLSAWVDTNVKRVHPARALLRKALRAYWLASGRPTGPWMAVRVPRRPRMRCRALAATEGAFLASEAKRRALEGTRKGLAVLFGLFAGLRRSEIAELRWSSISGDGWLRVVGKGAERVLPLHPVLVEALTAVRRGPSSRADGDPDFVFPGRAGHASQQTVYLWVRDVGATAGVGPVPCHVLRHTALATALDETGDLRAVQALAGHARPETTAGYTRVRSRRLVAAVSAIRYPA